MPKTEKLLPGLKPLLKSAPTDPDLFPDWLGEVLNEISMITASDKDLVEAFTTGLASMAARDAALEDHRGSLCWRHSFRRAALDCFEEMYEIDRSHFIELDAKDAAEEEARLAAMSASPEPGLH